MNVDSRLIGNERETKVLKLQTVDDLLKMKFFVPYYQRGYRWKEQQVRELLEDFATFRKSLQTPFYFLQALVVTQGENGRHHIVDGQQRLTTLALLLSALDVAWMAKEEEWITYAREADGTLDKYYREKAKDTIQSWLKNNANIKSSLAETVHRAAFLFYEVSLEDEPATFRRLNSGKIGAQDSELVKCILLTPQVDEPPETTHARAEEWDAMERALNDEDFFRFFTPRNAWRQEDRMSMVLRYAGFCPTVKERENDTCPFLRKVKADISATSREIVWKKISSAFYTLRGWYKNPCAYHAFGWYVHRRGAPECAALSAKDICSAMATVWEKNGMPAFGAEDIYHENWNQAFNVLFLFNAALCWRRGERYSFACHCEVEQWSLEHVFARNQRPLANASELAAFCPAMEDKWEEYSLANEQGKGDEWLAEHIPDGQYPEGEDGSLRNLALLSGSDNSSFNNSLFNGKRTNLVASLNQGHWFPPATVSVFQKAFSGMDPLKPYLSDSDKDAYQKAMQETITHFVEESKKVWEV